MVPSFMFDTQTPGEFRPSTPSTSAPSVGSTTTPSELSGDGLHGFIVPVPTALRVPHERSEHGTRFPVFSPPPRAGLNTRPFEPRSTMSVLPSMKSRAWKHRGSHGEQAKGSSEAA